MKNILITGGTRGLGLEYAKYLSTKNYNIGLTDISENACKVYGEAKSVESILKDIRKNKVEAWFSPADLTNQDEADGIVEKFISKFGVINGLIANAGGDISGKDSNAAGGKATNNSFFIDFAEYQNIFNRNYYTCFNTLRTVIPAMKNQGFGKIITFSSLNSVIGVEKETRGITRSYKKLKGSPSVKFLYHIIKNNQDLDQDELVKLSTLPKRTVQSCLSYLMNNEFIIEKKDIKDLRKKFYRLI